MAVNLSTNSNARKERARKAGKCQICGEKTKGHSVTIDYDKGTVTKSSAGKAKEGHAFYCSDHADQKVRRYEWKLNRKGTKSTTGKGSRKQKRGSASTTKAKKRASGGSKAKAAAKPARKRTRKPAASKAAGKAKGTKRAPKKAAGATKAAKKATPKRARKPAAQAESTEDEPF